jgi:hypothetical protein
MAVFGDGPDRPARLRGIRPCGKDRPALLGPFGRFSLSGARCRSSVVEHSIGNGEVDSSILSGSTSSPNNNNNLEHKCRNPNHQPLIE